MGRPSWRVHLQVCDRVQILTDSLSLCLQFDDNNQTKHWTYFYHWDPHHPIRTLHPSLYSVLNDSWHSTVCHQVGIIIIDYLTKNVRLKKKNLRWKPRRFYLESQDQQDKSVSLRFRHSSVVSAGSQDQDENQILWLFFFLKLSKLKDMAAWPPHYPTVQSVSAKPGNTQPISLSNELFHFDWWWSNCLSNLGYRCTVLLMRRGLYSYTSSLMTFLAPNEYQVETVVGLAPSSVIHFLAPKISFNEIAQIVF